MAKLDMLRPRIEAVDLRRVLPPAKTAEPFYSSAAWIKLRDQTRSECGNRCQHCGRGNTRIFVDHIIEIKDGGAALDRHNLTSLCGSCHTAKTNRERAKRMRAR